MKCFVERMKFEGRYDEYMQAKPPKPVPFVPGSPEWSEHIHACYLVAKKFGYLRYREVYRDIVRQLTAIAKTGETPLAMEMAAYRREYQVVVKNAMARMQAEQVGSKPFESDMEWLYQNWSLATIADPEHPGAVLPNPHGLQHAESTSIFTLADWATRNRDDFFKACFKHLTSKAKKEKESSADDEARIVDEGLAELDEYIRKFGT